MDNYRKILFLIPDSMYARANSEELGVSELYTIFKDYKQLDGLSFEGSEVDKKSIFMLNTSNSFFNYIHDQLCVHSISNLRLHIIDAERKMVLCLDFKKFKEMVEGYTRSVQRMRIKLLEDLSNSNEELLYMKKLSDGCEALSSVEGKPVLST